MKAGQPILRLVSPAVAEETLRLTAERGRLAGEASRARAASLRRAGFPVREPRRLGRGGAPERAGARGAPARPQPHRRTRAHGPPAGPRRTVGPGRHPARRDRRGRPAPRRPSRNGAASRRSRAAGHRHGRLPGTPRPRPWDRGVDLARHARFAGDGHRPGRAAGARRSSPSSSRRRPCSTTPTGRCAPEWWGTPRSTDAGRRMPPGPGGSSSAGCSRSRGEPGRDGPKRKAPRRSGAPGMTEP